MPFGNSRTESQRDSGPKPRVARNELPWETWPKAHNPNGVAVRRRWKPDATPLGLQTLRPWTQGSSLLATLGCKTQSLWDCRTASFASVSLGLSCTRNSRKALSPGLTHTRDYENCERQTPSPRPSRERVGVRGFELRTRRPPHPGPLLPQGRRGRKTLSLPGRLQYASALALPLATDAKHE